MHRLPYDVIAPEGEGDIAYSAAGTGAGAALLELPHGLDEIHGIAVVRADAGGDGEDVGVEDDVSGLHSHLFGQQPVGALANIDPVFKAGRLA